MDIQNSKEKIIIMKKMELKRIEYGLDELKYRLEMLDFEKENIKKSIQVQIDTIIKFKEENKELLKWQTMIAVCLLEQKQMAM